MTLMDEFKIIISKLYSILNDLLFLDPVPLKCVVSLDSVLSKLSSLHAL